MNQFCPKYLAEYPGREECRRRSNPLHDLEPTVRNITILQIASAQFHGRTDSEETIFTPNTSRRVSLLAYHLLHVPLDKVSPSAGLVVSTA